MQVYGASAETSVKRPGFTQSIARSLELSQAQASWGKLRATQMGMVVLTLSRQGV